MVQGVSSLSGLLKPTVQREQLPLDKVKNYFTLGYEIRKPYQSEDDYFRKNPTVAGMAAEDGKIILNPYSNLSEDELGSVATNEAYRLFMRENEIVPNIKLSEEQLKQFANTPYKNMERETKQTIIARILSGDPSALATPEQIKEAKRIESIATTPQSPVELDILKDTTK